MRKKAKSKCNKKGKMKNNSKADQPPTWVDRVMEDWIPVTSKNETASEGISISVINWNVLADSYCSRRSHRHLPLVFQNHVFDRHQRQHHVRRILRQFGEGNLQPDVIVLQEVDEPLDIPSCMEKCGYQGHHTPTDVSGRNGRVDACAIYFRKEKWRSLAVEPIQLDEIATLSSRNKSGSCTPSTRESLIGIESSFLRKNAAILVRLQHIETGQKVVLAALHLFWNPSYQEVKLCQSHYVATRAHAFADGDPVMILGDTNSQPGGPVHEYFRKGFTNAKQVAPWYNWNPYEHANNTHQGDAACADELSERLENLAVSHDETDSTPRVRYMLDFTLNRLCRWLRILGIDAGLETEEEERMRTKHGNLEIFERCRRERRTLITSSSKLTHRKDCPPGTYRLDTKALSNLELSLLHLLLSHGVTLEPTNVLSRCVVCNGEIDRVEDKQTKMEIFSTHNAPETLNDQNLQVWQCCGCKQGYWYDERPTSSASRVKNQATKLIMMCIRGGVPISKDMGMFDFIDVDKVRKTPCTVCECSDDDIVSLMDQRPDILGWLEKEKLLNPLGGLSSAFATEGGCGELLSFTNVTSDFVGLLDYIFHDSSFRVLKRLYVPTSFEELQDNREVRNGHLLPSDVWPSDHLAIGATFDLVGARRSSQGRNKTNNSEPTPKKSSIPEKIGTHEIGSTGTRVNNVTPSSEPASKNGKISEKIAASETGNTAAQANPLLAQFCLPAAHDPRCDCGCIPNVLSLHEMAELRRKAREARNKRAE